MGHVKRIWYLSPMRAAKVQASLHIRAVSPEPPLLAHTSSESRGTFRQKARSMAPLNGWACAVKFFHDGMLEDTNSLDAAHMFLWRTDKNYSWIIIKYPPYLFHRISPLTTRSWRMDLVLWSQIKTMDERRIEKQSLVYKTRSFTTESRPFLKLYLEWQRMCLAFFWVSLLALHPSNPTLRLPLAGRTEQTRKKKESCHEKTCLHDFRPGKTQTGLLSYRSKLESWNFGNSK